MSKQELEIRHQLRNDFCSLGDRVYTLVVLEGNKSVSEVRVTRKVALQLLKVANAVLNHGEHL